MGYRHPNPRLVKIHRNYSVEQIARLFGTHKNTVRKWLKEGLPAIDDQRPTLVLGHELSRFLIERRQTTKQSCGLGRIFCVACRAPKVPAGHMADCISTNGTMGICAAFAPTAAGSSTGASISPKSKRFEAIWRSRSGRLTRA